MFSTALHRRPSLQPLVPLLYSHDPPFKARPFQTHDLALPLRDASSTSSPKSTIQPQPHQQPLAPPPTPPAFQLFLLVTPSDLSPTQEAATLERISRFSTLTATPKPVIAMILSTPSPSTTLPPARQPTQPTKPTATDEEQQQQSMQAYLHLQTLLHFLPSSSSSSSPSFTHPPPILPIPSLSNLLSLLTSYTASLLHPLTAPSPLAIHLLPLLTPTAPTTMLKAHTVHVLSDLCHSLLEIAWIGEREEGRFVVREWLGEREGGMVMRFFDGGV